MARCCHRSLAPGVLAAPRDLARERWRGVGFDQVPVGVVRVVVKGDFTKAVDVSDSMQVTGNEPVIIPVPLVRNVELRIRVLDGSGDPVPEARVEVFSHTGRSSMFMSTGAGGSATFRAHPAHEAKATVTIGGKLVTTTVVRPGSAPTEIVVRAR